VEEKLLNRRQALNKLSVTGLSLAAGFASFIGGGFLYPIPRTKPPALFVCLESEVSAANPLEIRDLQGRKVLLRRKADGTLLALGTVCSHLGCAVFYRPDSRQFECPCHQGFFDEEGNPVAGPPQRPLARYPVEAKEGKIFVQFA